MFDNHPLPASLLKIIAAEKLPPEFKKTASTYFVPLAQRLIALHRQVQRPLLVGINGAQGTGKSTLALVLQQLLKDQGLSSVIVSIDDLYLTQAEREQLAHSIHPLLKTRGVPGTHDVEMGIALIQQLLAAHETSTIAIPRFNKATDDRYPASAWSQHQGPADIVLFEGWCVGARASDLSDAPINQLERESDPDGRWRGYVNQQLSHRYQPLFAMIDYLIMLKAPSMDCITRWRGEQEQKLAEKLQVSRGASTKTTQTGADGAPYRGLMDENALHWFIMHYERITRSMLADMPAYADEVFHLDEQHQITHAECR